VPHEERDYSSTPLSRKLGIREGSRLRLVGGPKGFDAALEPLPPGVRIVPSSRGPLDVAVLFVTRRGELEQRFSGLAKLMEPDGRLWVAWPKKASRVETDVTFELAQGIGLAAGLVDNKSAAIDEVFQGLQFVTRLRDRPQPR
jgi:hypothetical protein